MKDIRLEKWRVCVIFFIAAWSIGIVTDLLDKLKWNADTRWIVLHNLLWAGVLASIFYIGRVGGKEEK
jgi:hypothetical protein